MKTHEKYLVESSMGKIREIVNDIIRHNKNKKKPLSYEYILVTAQEHGMYDKHELPDLQGEIEDAGYEIDYDNWFI